ncbi:DNA polymerase III subunit Tau [Bordetella pertussis]|nr:DNA polymerase III subunit Tau [Bordetella pertussis]
MPVTGLAAELARQSEWAGVPGDGTAHAVAQIERAARQQAAEDAVAVDPFVQALVADFGGRVVPGSIRHVDNPPAA